MPKRRVQKDLTLGENDDYSGTSHENLASISEAERQQRALIHKQIEADRRKVEQRCFKELSSLLPHWYDVKSSKQSQVMKLKLATDLLEQITTNQSSPLFPSYLTEHEKNFLDIQVSNSFLFVTTCERAAFRIIHVSDSIERVLHVQPDQWRGQDFCRLTHPEDSPIIQNQLLNLTRHIGQQITLTCRLNDGQNSYASVTIDGMIKELDQSIIPIGSTQNEYYAFVGICHLPLVEVYSQKNRDLQRVTEGNLLTCRCSPNTWEIFLVNGSISSEILRNRPVLDFIYNDDRNQVRQALCNASTLSQEQSTFCNFLHPSGDILMMLLKIKPIVNRSIHKLDYLEVIFDDYTDRVNNDLGLLQ